MTEHYVLRVLARNAHMVFAPEEGRDLGLVKVIKIRRDDVRLPAILDVQRSLEAQHDFLVAGWSIDRKYTSQELLAAEWLHPVPTKVILASGEECGTSYDEKDACPECTWGSVQLDLLSLPDKKIPLGADLNKTWGDEWVVSKRFRSVFGGSLGDGVHFSPITRCASESGFKARDSRVIDCCEQIHFAETAFKIVPPTLFQEHLINTRPESRSGHCSLGHTLGLNLISELSVEHIGMPTGWVSRTVNGYGSRQGLFRPVSPLVVNQSFYRRWSEAGLRGIKFEVVHCVS